MDGSRCGGSVVEGFEGANLGMTDLLGVTEVEDGCCSMELRRGMAEGDLEMGDLDLR